MKTQMRQSGGRRGFTLVELLVVIAMLMVLAGAVTSSVSAANLRAKITQATSDVQEMTNAILAYENYGRAADESPLRDKKMEAEAATEDKMAFILGKETLKNGQSGNIPVLFNAQIRQGAIRDPWGRPYYVTIRETTIDPETDASGNNMRSFVAFPNFYRRPADEVK